QLPAYLPTLYDYFFDTEELKWVAWADKIQLEEKDDQSRNPEQRPSFHQILIPTVDTVRLCWLLEVSIKAKAPILFVGESGTAKSVTINSFLNKLDPDKYVRLNMNFSSTTTSLDVQRTLESNVERWTKGTYGPAPGKQLIVFIDDLNMPMVDEYETQQPIALLK